MLILFAYTLSAAVAIQNPPLAPTSLIKETVGFYFLQRLGGELKRDPDFKYRVEVEFHFKDNRRRDVDDYLKILLDALTGVVWVDDSQIERVCATKFQGEKSDYIFIRIQIYE